MLAPLVALWEETAAVAAQLVGAGVAGLLVEVDDDLAENLRRVPLNAAFMEVDLRRMK